jgi:hypothetical protein
MHFEETDRGAWGAPLPAPLEKTYCNPLPLPDYPRGRASRFKESGGWLNSETPVDFRELADPSVLYWDGRWYLYPSAGMAWVSEDFVTWRHRTMNLDDVGYAPTVMAHRDRFYLTACGANLFCADSPLGPWRDLGPLRRKDGAPLGGHYDPMLFADDDGRVYLYWGCGAPAIFGIELDETNPTRAVGDPRLLFAYHPEHVWERYGDFNEDPSVSWCEGPWMFKHARRYYLTYTAPGTTFNSYGMGVYIADAPLGPFRYGAGNPILRDTEGLVRGPGHGCLVRGPQDTLWAFYTCTRCYHHMFERRIGMDPAGFDAEGNLFVRGASETPQWAPGVLARPQDGNATGLLPVTINKYPRASSVAPGRDPVYAIDRSLRTWWQAAADDPQPWLGVDLWCATPFTVAAVRLAWAEPGLHYDRAPPGPMQYRVEGRATPDAPWSVLLDRTANREDMLIDYQTFPPRAVKEVRLVVTDWPRGIGVGVSDFSVFGVGGPPPAGKYGVIPSSGAPL